MSDMKRGAPLRRTAELLSASARVQRYAAIALLHAVEAAAFRFDLDRGAEPLDTDEDSAFYEQFVVWEDMTEEEREAANSVDWYLDGLQQSIYRMEGAATAAPSIEGVTAAPKGPP